MKFILTSKSWSFAINRAAAIAEEVVVAEAEAVVDQAVAIVTIIVEVVAVTTTTVIWVDRVRCIMAVVVAAAVEAATIGTIVEILTCQTYNR